MITVKRWPSVGAETMIGEVHTMTAEQIQASIKALEDISKANKAISATFTAALAAAVSQFDIIDKALVVLRDYMALDLLEGGDTKPAPTWLGVPWIGQNVIDVRTDDYSSSDCGPACVAMWLNYTGRGVTVDDVSIATGLTRGYTYTLPAHLITAAGHFALPLKRMIGLTHEAIKAEIDKARPVIVLVHYGSLPKRYSTIFTAGHWLIITGYGDDYITYNDPLWQDTTGEQMRMSWRELDQAMADCVKDGNTANQGLVQA